MSKMKNSPQNTVTVDVISEIVSRLLSDTVQKGFFFKVMIRKAIKITNIMSACVITPQLTT